MGLSTSSSVVRYVFARVGIRQGGKPVLSVVNSSVSQINLPAVFVANGLGICLLLAILYGKRTGVRTKTRDESLFHRMCQICFALCVLEMCGFVLDGRQLPGARQLSMICSTTMMLLAVVLAYLWICYVDCKLLLNHKKTRINCILAAIPAGSIGLMALANLFFPVFFWVSETNDYYRTQLIFLPWLVVYGYMAWGAFQSYRYQRRADKRLFIPAMVFLIPIYLGSLIQLLFYGISLTWVSVALGLTYLYINLQNEQAYQDSLTGLYNRSYLLHYMDHVARKDLRITGIMLDVNDFKQINDTMGHAAGDAVLRATGGLLLQAARDNTVIRYEGDEFFILVESVRQEEVQTVLDNIQRELEAYNDSNSGLPPFSFAIGTAEFDQQGISRFFHKMDMEMYEKKRDFYLQKETPSEISSNDV